MLHILRVKERNSADTLLFTAAGHYYFSQQRSSHLFEHGFLPHVDLGETAKW